MNKQQIDTVIEIIVRISNSGDILNELGKLCELCRNQELKVRISNIINEFQKEKEKVNQSELETIFVEIINDINSQIPEELLFNYYYVEAYLKGVSELLMLSEEQEEIAQSILEKTIEKRLENGTVDEKVEIAKEFFELGKTENAISIVRSLSDEKKIELLDKVKHYYKKIIIAEIIDEELIVDVALDKLIAGQEDIIKGIKDDELKVKALDKIAIQLRLEVVKTINDEELRLKAALKLGELDQIEIMKTITENDNLKNEALEVVRKILKKYKDYKLYTLSAIDMFEGDEWFEIAKKFEDKEKLELLGKTDEKQRIKLIKTIQDPEVMLMALDKLEGDYREVLKRLYQVNNDVVKNIDMRFLEQNYLETLGEDRINLISCYQDVQSQILKLEGKEYEIFVKCLDCYQQNNETDEWNVVASYLLENLLNGEYSKLINNIENIEEIDIEKLLYVIQQPNVYEINSVEELTNFEEIKRKKCDTEIKKDNYSIDYMKDWLMLKIFGIDREFVRRLLEKYGEDIENINDGDQKDFILSLKLIKEISDVNVLNQIYNECEEVIIDKLTIERALKTEYGKTYNQELYRPKEDDIIKEDDLSEELKRLGLKVYEAGTDFKMIITSIAPYHENEPTDFKKDWNRPAIGTQHFCASYIRNDMVGTPPIPHLCYGFYEMKEDALMLSGPTDIYSSADKMISTSGYGGKDVYYTPDTQINRTAQRVDNGFFDLYEVQPYNEMDFRRIQGGIKKQPDYIIAFKRNGTIDNIEKIIKASKDWGGKLPIVIVDVDKCLEAEKQKVKEMFDEYEISKEPQLAKRILYKVRNNRVTDNTFCAEMNEELVKMLQDEDVLKIFLDIDIAKQDNVEEQLKQNYEEVTAEERKEAISEIRRLYDKIKEIAMRKDGDGVEH